MIDLLFSNYDEKGEITETAILGKILTRKLLKKLKFNGKLVFSENENEIIEFILSWTVFIDVFQILHKDLRSIVLSQFE
ncbi:hypothetical protein MHBO_001020, partial [Bonamia ostreae]